MKGWGHIFADDEMATTAILDRLFHRVHLFNTDGRRNNRLKNFDKVMKKVRIVDEKMRIRYGKNSARLIS